MKLTGLFHFLKVLMKGRRRTEDVHYGEGRRKECIIVQSTGEEGGGGLFREDKTHLGKQ